MKRESYILIVLALLFCGVVWLASQTSPADNKPYSSYSAAPDGTKAAFLLLKDLGFKVERNNRKDWRGDGILIALGDSYLEDTSGALTLPEDHHYTNAWIREHATEFVEQLWPYRESVIVFQEYGRRLDPLNDSPAGTDMTLWSILPAWIQLILLGGGLIAFFLMFFYGQRLGEPLVAEGFEGRRPLESVYAMAAALEKSSAYRDCADYYYRYCARHGAHWDKDGALAAGIAALDQEVAACKLLAKMDQSIKEYRDEGK